MASAPVQAKPDYLQVYHQPHHSIFVPIVGSWKEIGLVASVKQQILQKVKEGKEAVFYDGLTVAVRDIRSMLIIIDKYREEGQTRTLITSVFCIPLFFAGIIWASTAMVLSSVALAIFVTVEWIRLGNQNRQNMGFIEQINRTLERKEYIIDLDPIALHMR